MKVRTLSLLMAIVVLSLTSSRIVAGARLGSDHGESISTGDRLDPGDWMTSQNGRLVLTYQGDGNLVLYDTSTSPWTPTWSSGVTDNNPGYLGLELNTSADGNLFTKDGDNHFTWFNSPWYSTGDLVLLAQNDGNLVLYRNGVPVWDTGTWFGPSPRH